MSPSDGYTLYSTNTIYGFGDPQGHVPMVVESDTTPPRLLGDGCGCVRERTERGWKLTLCQRHEVEVRGHRGGTFGGMRELLGI